LTASAVLETVKHPCLYTGSIVDKSLLWKPKT